MKLRHLFTINIFIAILIGLSCSLLPGWLLRLYGLVPDDASIWVTRLVGGSILGYATLMWFGRRDRIDPNPESYCSSAIHPGRYWFSCFR